MRAGAAEDGRPEIGSSRPGRGSTAPAVVALSAGILAIGFSAIFVKLAAVPGPVSAFYRLLFAGVIAVPLWGAAPGPRPSKREVLWVLLGGVFFASDLILWNSSLLHISAATATLLGNAAPLWVGLGAFFLLGERWGKKYWGGLVAALAGLTVLVGRAPFEGMGAGRGELMALGASLFYAAYLLATQKARARVRTIPFMALSILPGVVVTLAAVLLSGQPLTGYPASTWIYLGGLGLVTHLGGWLAINYALGHLPAARVSVSLLGQAVVTALLAIPILGEGLSLRQVTGGALVLGGIALVNLAPGRRARRQS